MVQNINMLIRGKTFILSLSHYKMFQGGCWICHTCWGIWGYSCNSVLWKIRADKTASACVRAHERVCVCATCLWFPVDLDEDNSLHPGSLSAEVYLHKLQVVSPCFWKLVTSTPLHPVLILVYLRPASVLQVIIVACEWLSNIWVYIHVFRLRGGGESWPADMGWGKVPDRGQTALGRHLIRINNFLSKENSDMQIYETKGHVICIALWKH